MPKVILNNLSSLANETSAIATINANNAAISEGFNNTISRDGTSPNTMEDDLNMNTHRVYNVPLIPLTNADVATKYYVDVLAGTLDPGNDSFEDINVINDLTVGGNTTLSGDLTVEGATILESTLAVTDAATLNSTLTVTGDTTLNSNLILDDDLTVGGISTLDGNLIVNGTSTLNDNLTVDGNTVLDGNLTVNGAVTFSEEFTANVLTVYNVKVYGATGDGVTDDTQAILDAIAAATTGGIIYFPEGNYSVTNLDAPASTWDNDVAIHILTDNIHIKGAGRGATIITLAASSDAHVFKFGRRFEGAVAVSDCSISSLTINGNRDNQTTPAASEDHWNGIDVATGATRVVLSDLHIHDCQYYGIGFQDEGFIDCNVHDVVIETTGADGIDCKNNDNLSYGNTISNLTVREFGLVAGLLSDQAGVDIYGGWHLNNITVTDYGTELGKCGIRFQSDDAAFDQSTAPSLVNFYCEGDDSADTMGVRVNAHYASISNGEIYNCEIGFQINQRENKINNVHVESCETGFQLNDFGGTTASPCERNVLTNCVARGNTGTGFFIAACDENSLIGCVGRSNVIGADIDTGCNDTLIIGGAYTSNSSSQVVDDGTRSTIVLPSLVRFGATNQDSWQILGKSAVAVAHTGTTSETTLATIAVPANAMGPNGVLRITCLMSNNNSGNTKTLQVKFNGTAFWAVAPTTTLTARGQGQIHNRNSASSQVGGPNGTGGWATAGGAAVTSAHNTTGALNITITGTLANSGDNMTLEYYLVELLYGA